MAEGSRGSKKPGKKKKKACNIRYIAEKRHVKSHIKRLKVAVATNPRDIGAKEALRRYELML